MKRKPLWARKSRRQHKHQLSVKQLGRRNKALLQKVMG